MTADLDRIADAVLFEGYLLYPYHRSATKNRTWWPFGTIYPEAFVRALGEGDASSLELQCLVRGGADMAVQGRLRFLQLDEDRPQVRAVELSLTAGQEQRAFAFGPLAGAAACTWSQVSPDVVRLTVHVTNASAMGETGEPPERAEALRRAMASCHLLLTIEGGEFVSLIDPPAAVAGLAAACRSSGLWPVLVGEPGTASALLAAPIILPDHPQVAPESPGDLFDGTEIDEILTLRILTLTDDEKAELAGGDPRARALLERTLALDEDALRGLHGRLERRVALRPGAAVRLRPGGRADIFDLALAGQRATVESVEQDLEGRTYVVVTVDDDPGRDLGAFGHRFFFRPEEVDLL